MTELEQALAELAAAEAELAKAKRELAEAEAASKSKPKRKATNKKRTKRPIHHPESDLHHEVTGYGGPMPSDVRVRPNVIPVVTRELDPTDRPVNDEYVGHECLFEIDGSFDSMKRCKCANCGQYK